MSKPPQSIGIRCRDRFLALLLACLWSGVVAVAQHPVDSARIHLPFDGDDEGQYSAPWRNRGVTGFDEAPGRAGTNAIATVTSAGLKGSAYDGRHLTNLAAQSSYMWGEFGDPPAGDTPVEASLIDLWSFTFTAWIRADASLTQGRVIASIPLEINYVAVGDQARLATRVGSGESFINSPNAFAAVDEWLFFAVTYDGQSSVSNLNWYVGTETNAVAWVGSANVGVGQLLRDSHGGNFWLGNVANHTSGNRPFVGRMDELRLWSSSVSTESAALTPAQLLTVQQFDLGVTPPSAPELLPAVDIIDHSFRINWRSVSSAEHYRIDVATDPDFGDATLPAYSNVVANAPLFSVTNVAVDTTYYFRVRAVNEYGAGSASEIGFARTTTTPDIPTSGLRMHLSATALTHLTDGDGVEQWPDLSGHGNHAMQADIASRPLFRAAGMGGGPSLEFDGETTSLQVPTLQIPGEMTVLILALDEEQSNSGSLHKVLLAADNDPYATDASGTGYGFGYRRAGNDGVGVYLSDGAQVNLVIQTGPPSLQPEILAFRRSNQRLSFSRNGRLVNEGALPREAGFHTGYLIGNETTFGGRFYLGEIAEILVYDRPLSPVEQLRIEQYLAEQYGLDIPTQPPAAGIRLWLREGQLQQSDPDSSLLRWPDASPFQSDAVQADAALQPTVIQHVATGRRSVRFNGLDQFMNVNALHIGHDMTALFVVENRVQAADEGSVHRPVLTAQGGAYRVDGSGYGFGFRRPGFDGFFTYLGSGEALENVGKLQSPDGEMEAWVIHKDDTDTRLFRNGERVAEGALNRPSSVEYQVGYRLGGAGASPQFYQGDISEVLVYDRAITESELAQLKRYLVIAHGVSTDPRHLENGVVILRESYADQPYVTRLANGQWLAVTTVSPDIENSPERHLVLSWSSDQGQTWSAPVAGIEPLEELRQPSWATLYTTPFGRVYAFYNLNAEVGSKPLYSYRYSDDNGTNWSERFLLPVRDTNFEALYGDVRHWGIDQPVEMDGAVFFGFSKFQQLTPRNGEGWLFRSDNLMTETNAALLNWEMLPLGDDGIRNPALGSLQEEHNLVPFRTGELYVVYRTLEGYVAHSYSRDAGETWELPEFATYAPGGRPIKNPRALPRVWKTDHNRYLLWIHNHDGRDVAARNRNRNPGWILGGREVDGLMHWSQPEVLLYGSATMLPGMSYPDLIQEDDRFWITQTEKTTARIHEIDIDLLEGVWSQHANFAMTHSGLVEWVTTEALTETNRFALGELPDLLDGGITVELWVRIDEWIPGQVVATTRDGDGPGWSIVIDSPGALRFELSDGSRFDTCTSDAGLMQTGEWHHLAFVVDGGPNLITIILDGQLLDGGTDRQYGWCWFNQEMGRVDGGDLIVAPLLNGDVRMVRVYDRYLRTSEVIGNWRHTVGPYPVQTLAGPNGAISPVNPLIERGADVTLTILPDTWYDIEDVQVDLLSVGAVSAYTFTNVTSSRTLTASFAAQRTGNTATPLWWLAQYGYTNDFEAAALAQLDGTGYANWQQYIAGTDPTDPNSVLRFDAILTGQSEDLEVQWSAVPGRVYTLYSITNLVTGNEMMPIATNLVHPQEQYRVPIGDVIGGFMRLGVELDDNP
jgi:hypothetical protein